MEHIVQFGVSIDDKVIQERIIENSQKQIIESISKECCSCFFNGTPEYRWNRSAKVQEIIVKEIEAFMKQNKDEIINLTSEKLAEKMSRTKVIKEAIIKTVLDE